MHQLVSSRQANYDQYFEYFMPAETQSDVRKIRFPEYKQHRLFVSKKPVFQGKWFQNHSFLMETIKMGTKQGVLWSVRSYWSETDTAAHNWIKMFHLRLSLHFCPLQTFQTKRVKVPLVTKSPSWAHKGNIFLAAILVCDIQLILCHKEEEREQRWTTSVHWGWGESVHYFTGNTEGSTKNGNLKLEWNILETNLDSIFQLGGNNVPPPDLLCHKWAAFSCQSKISCFSLCCVANNQFKGKTQVIWFDFRPNNDTCRGKFGSEQISLPEFHKLCSWSVPAWKCCRYEYGQQTETEKRDREHFAVAQNGTSYIYMKYITNYIYVCCLLTSFGSRQHQHKLFVQARIGDAIISSCKAWLNCQHMLVLPGTHLGTPPPHPVPLMNTTEYYMALKSAQASFACWQPKRWHLSHNTEALEALDLAWQSVGWAHELT